ncbi:acyl carrier protein [Mycoplasmopsis sturni]|uniref:acyl carrier protein n=1 Tax=Mycoplasmopsis sturni TaxID=39047 RepID=UPI000A05FD49|nr:acyl carrier protein [Mycoplasmopsis sturni]
MKKDIKETIFKELKGYTKKSFDEETLISDLGIDSLDFAELIIDAEETFEVTIDDNKLNDVKTVRDVILLIENSKN